MSEMRLKVLPPNCRKFGKELSNPDNFQQGLLVDEKLLERLTGILMQSDHNNIALVGDPGVGKTATVQALGQFLVRTNQSFRLAEIDLNLLFAECPTYSEQGLRLKHLFREAEEHSIVLFFDEGHRLCNDHGSNSVANIVKPLVTNPRLQLILATTCEEYQRYIATDRAFRRRFRELEVAEPNPQDTARILESVAKARYRDIAFEDGVFAFIAELSQSIMEERYNPDKSLEVLDAASGRHRLLNPDAALNVDEVKTTVREQFSEAEPRVGFRGHHGL